MTGVHSIKQKLPPRLQQAAATAWRSTLGRQYPKKAWSQGGEDLVLLELLGDCPPGSYLDVGAFHPRWGSNTHALYQRGWTGINVDARPGSMAPFRRARTRDVNLEMGVAAHAATLDFHVFADDELSTFDQDLAQERQKKHRLLSVQPVHVVPLLTIIEQHRPQGIDVLTVDVEGLDLEVLGSNNWDRFRPRLVLVESLAQPARLTNSRAVQFMAGVDYEVVAATGMNLFFAPTSNARD